MSREHNQDVFRRLIEEGFDKGNLEALDDCFPPHFTEHQFDMPSTREGLKGTIHFLRETFAPFSLTIEDMISDGDMVWARLTGRGTDSTGFMGRPPSGKSFAITVIDVCRFDNGKIVEHWGVPDRFHQLAQLGLLPQAPQQAAQADHVAVHATGR
jgi:predicted ester cyclase